MKLVSIKESKDKLPALIHMAEDGEDVVITRNGKPVARIVPYKPKGGLDFEALRKWKEERGLPQVIIGKLAPDFDDPLPEDFLITPGPA